MSFWAIFSRTPETLAFEREWAGVPPGVLSAVARNGSLSPHFRYRRFTKPKDDGGRRAIAEPDARLKRLQAEIASRYLSEMPHPAALAYRRGLSVADHAWAHAGAEVVVTADVADFFPATAAWRVGRWWEGRASPDEARVLTVLTTDRGGLPQGAPTSPGLSNLVNRELDEALTRRATLAGARYTRYCDDLAFSWRLGGPPSDFEAGVRAALGECGYTPHPRKGWRVFGRDDEPEVTGLVLGRDGRVRLPERLRRAMREARGPARDGYRAYEAMVKRRRVP